MFPKMEYISLDENQKETLLPKNAHRSPNFTLIVEGKEPVECLL